MLSLPVSFLLQRIVKRGMNAPFGAGLTKRAYQLNVSAFLNASKQYLMNNDSWESNKFDLEEYSDEQKIIFCEGFRVIDNPLFNHLPFAPTRGETLQIKTMAQTPMSNGSWYLPDGLGCALIAQPGIMKIYFLAQPKRKKMKL